MIGRDELVKMIHYWSGSHQPVLTLAAASGPTFSDSLWDTIRLTNTFRDLCTVRTAANGDQNKKALHIDVSPCHNKYAK